MKLSQTSLASFDLLTHVDMSLSVSVFTVLIALIRGCFVTISPFSAIATEMFSLRQRYTLSMSKYILPSWVTKGWPTDLHPLTFVFRIFPNCLTTSISLRWSIFCSEKKKQSNSIKLTQTHVKEMYFGSAFLNALNHLKKVRAIRHSLNKTQTGLS